MMNPPAAEQVTHVPPHDIEMEAMLLGCLLLGEKDGLDVMADVRGRITPGEFYKRTHQQIYAVCLALFDRGDPLAPAFVARELERLGLLADVGGRDEVARLCRDVSSPAHASQYATELRDLAVRRRVIQVVVEIDQDARVGASGRDLLDRMEHEMLQLRITSDVKRPETVREVVGAVLQRIEHPSSEPAGLSSGLRDLDTMLGGYGPGQMIVVAGRTGMGKTSFALSSVRQAYVEDGVPTLVVSAEMSNEEITGNLLASIAGVDGKRVRDSRFLRTSDSEALRRAATKLEGAPLHLFDASPVDVPAIRSHARRIMLRGGLGFLVVDYIQLIQGTGLASVNRATSREQEVSAISRAMKGLARELGVPVLVLAQLNRMAEAREDHRPRLSDLRESGAIENDADSVLLIFRPACYARTDAERAALNGQTEIHVAKQRSGPTGVVHAFFRAEQTRFENATRASQTEEASR